VTDGPDNLILLYLRRIDEKVDRIADDVQDLKVRVTAIEGRLAIMTTEMVAMSLRLDRLETRVERIERRWGLAGAA